MTETSDRYQEKGSGRELTEAETKMWAKRLNVREKLPIMLKIDNATDVRFMFDDALPDEKVVKMSNAYTIKNPISGVVLFKKPRLCHRFLVLTNMRFGVIECRNESGSWKAEMDYDVMFEHIISVKSQGDNLIINYVDEEWREGKETYQEKIQTENSDKWVKEINSAVEKSKA